MERVFKGPRFQAAGKGPAQVRRLPQSPCEICIKYKKKWLFFRATCNLRVWISVLKSAGVYGGFRNFLTNQWIFKKYKHIQLSARRWHLVKKTAK
ncbi:hypothetical protein [uncultured Oscillibacter sp.]|uniref:hypothetical protein n=1 Tax=uncultured Oscillibacter sp. TaxID=876091 RepID=UPI0025D2E7E3|nr:hypothetical protein [uncultured Oscillibacter sp.]